LPVMRVDDDVFRELQLRVNQDRVFKDTPNQVLRRVLRIDTADTQGTGNSLFELLVKYFERYDKNAIDEVHRRFRAFGWVNPNLTSLTPEQMERHKRRSDAAKRAVETKRRKYKTWPTRKRDHK
jgi:hypothetical protein